MSNVETHLCSRCNGLCVICRLGETQTFPLMARERETDLPVCDDCVAAEIVALLSAGQPAGVYVIQTRSNAGTNAKLTTFGGRIIGYATTRNVSPWHGRELYTWRGRVINGPRVYGRYGSFGEYSIARAYKADVTR